MAFTSDDYLRFANDSRQAASVWAARGDRERSGQLRITAVLEVLKAAVRRADGLALLLSSDVAPLLREAAPNSSSVHPTHLLDAAHVALLVGERDIARAWLSLLSVRSNWSEFWRFYSSALLNLLEGRNVDGVAPLDLPEQELWRPYVDLMRALTNGSATGPIIDEIQRSFNLRQARLNDPGLLDGRVNDQVLWDWRLAAITVIESTEGSTRS